MLGRAEWTRCAALLRRCRRAGRRTRIRRRVCRWLSGDVSDHCLEVLARADEAVGDRHLPPAEVCGPTLVLDAPLAGLDAGRQRTGHRAGIAAVAAGSIAERVRP